MLAFLSGFDLAAVILILAAILLVGGVFHRSLTLKFGRLEGSIGQVDQKVESVDKAVNQRPSDQPTISHDVRYMRDAVTRMEKRQTVMSAEQTMHRDMLQQVGANARAGVALAERAAELAVEVKRELDAYRGKH